MTPGFLDLKNSENLAKWRWRWHQQGGGFHYAAHDLQDLRNDDQRKWWRAIVFEVRRLTIHKRRANLARLRIERASNVSWLLKKQAG